MKSIAKEIKYETNLKPSFDKLKELEFSSNVKGIGVTCKGTKKYGFIEKIIWFFYSLGEYIGEIFYRLYKNKVRKNYKIIKKMI